MITEGLLRQRRNLFIVCVLLWFMKYGGVTLNKMAFAGFEVTLMRPDATFLALWLAFGYFLYRYYQYFATDGLSKLISEYSNALEARCLPLIYKRVIASNPSFYNSPDYSYSKLKQNGWVVKGDERVSTEGAVDYSRPFELRITRWELRRGILISFLESTFRSSAITDYLLPFALAGFVLWYCGSGDWSGSFLHLIFK